MGERKVINKYYPADFDPLKVPKAKRPKNNQIKVRMMLPMSIQCNTCSEFLYRGKKFNSYKETVIGEDYLGIKIFRLYIKCNRCSAEITIKTDPKNGDYICEWGASRNFEPWRENRIYADAQREHRKKEELGDAMKALENRTYDNKIETEILDALDEIRALNAHNSKVDPFAAFLLRQQVQDEQAKRLSDEDEELVRNLFGGKDNGEYVKRIYEEDEVEEDYSTETAMHNLLCQKAEGMEYFSVKKAKTEPEPNVDRPKLTVKSPKPLKVVPKIIVKPKATNVIQK